MLDLPNPSFPLWLIKNLKSILECDIIFKWFAFPAMVFVGKAFGKPTVLNAVGVDVATYPDISYGWPSWWYARAITSIGLRNADYVLAISKESKKWAERWGARNVRVIYEGIDTNKFKYRRKSWNIADKKIVTVAYLGLMNIVRKDFFTLFRALKLVLPVLPGVKLTIVGEKKDGYPILVKTAEDLGISHAIIFKDFLDFGELLNILYEASVFVMPSLQEGFPTALCEALSCGVPVITTIRPAMNEVFKNRVNALLVEAGNDQKLAEAIIALLTNKGLANSIARRGSKMIREKYSKEVRAKNLEEYFAKIAKERLRNGHSGVNICWLTVFLVLCFVSPLIMLVRSLCEASKSLIS